MAVPVVPAPGAVFEKAPSVRGPFTAAAVTALAAFRIPGPHSAVVQVLVAANGVVVRCSSAIKPAGVSDGCTDFTRAATADTCGAAMLVPSENA